MKDAELRGRFDSIERRFERTDTRFEQMDARFEQMDARFERIDARFERIDARFEQVLRAIVEVNAETRRILAVAILNTREELSGRIDAVAEKLDSFRDDTHTSFDHVYGRFDRLETEYYSISAGLSRVEKKISEEPQA